MNYSFTEKWKIIIIKNCCLLWAHRLIPPHDAHHQNFSSFCFLWNHSNESRRKEYRSKGGEKEEQKCVCMIIWPSGDTAGTFISLLDFTALGLMFQSTFFFFFVWRKLGCKKITGKRKLGAGTKSNYPTAYVNSSFGLYDVEGIKISYGFPLTCWI